MNESQTTWVLTRLLREPQPLTPREALNERGIMRLAARVRDLRKRGYAVSTLRIDVPTRRGDRATVAGYVLAKEAPHE